MRKSNKIFIKGSQKIINKSKKREKEIEREKERERGKEREIKVERWRYTTEILLVTISNFF